MGEGADVVRNGAPESEDVGRVAGEITTLRDELGGLVAELDRRRHEALDLRLQVSRHPVLVGTVATVAAVLVGGAIALAVRNARRRRRPAVRAREARAALARLFEHPRRVAAEPSIGNKIATAVGVAIATTLAKRLIERSVRPTPCADDGAGVARPAGGAAARLAERELAAVLVRSVLGAIAHVGHARLVRAVRAAEGPPLGLGAVPDHAAPAVGAARRERLDRALEAVEHVALPGGLDLERLVVLVPADLARPRHRSPSRALRARARRAGGRAASSRGERQPVRRPRPVHSPRDEREHEATVPPPGRSARDIAISSTQPLVSEG